MTRDRTRTPGTTALAVVLLITGPAWTSAQPLDVPPEVLAYADTVFYNGKVLTADDAFTIAEAVAVRDGKFLAVGTSATISRMAGPKTRRIDLQGRTAVPGFWDTHYHIDDHALRMMLLEGKRIAWEGKNRWNTLWWDDIPQAMRDIEKAVKAAAPGELVWIPVTVPTTENIVFRMTMQQLDQLSPNNPLVISGPVELQPVAANSRVYKELVSIPPDTPGLPSGTSCRIAGQAQRLLHDYLRWVTPIDVQIPWHKEAMRRANALGIVGVDTRVEPAHITAYREIWAAGEMTIRLRAAIQVIDGADDPERILRSMGNLSDIGDDLLRITGISAGGSLGGGGIGFGQGWTFAPQIHPKDPKSAYGRQGWSNATARDEFIAALRYGWNISNTHVVGDRAVAEFLAAMEEARKHPVVKSRTQRLTIDHTPMARPEEIAKMKALGVYPSIAPWHLFEYGGIDEAVALYGADRVNRMLPIKSYIDTGLKPSLEADVLQAPSGTPLWKIQKAVTRKDDKGRVWGAAEKISRQQALWMSTNWSTYHTGDEKRLGSIEPGKIADLVVLGKDYLAVPEDQISEIPIAMTVVGGNIVYDANRQ